MTRKNRHQYGRYYGMEKLTRPAMVVVTSLCLFLGAAVMPDTKMEASVSNSQRTASEPAHAKGTFEVKVVPQGAEDKGEGSTLGRLSLTNSSTAISRVQGKGRC